MLAKTRTSLLSLAVIAVLIFSAIGPTIVYADGDNPPTTTTDTIVEQDDGDNHSGACDSDKEGGKNKKGKKNKSRNRNSSECSSDGAAADTSGGEGESSDADPAAEVPDTSDADSTEEAAPPVEEAAPPSDSNLLTAVPENTSVTVLNAYGEAEPLATQDAANAIASTTDPIWCPQGQPPIPGANGCTQSFTSFDALLTFLAGNAAFQGAGTIFVEQGAYGGSESVIDFNAYNLSNISGSNLTVQGGWDTTPNPVDPATAGTSDFGVSIIIGSSANPWGGSLTLNNIQILNPQNTGLTLYSQSNINIANVTVDNSANGDGAVLNAGADVTINNSHFLRNTAGARITAGNNVAIANSEFSNPFNQRRQVTGLEITSAGSVSLFNVLAIGNRRRGADINAGGRVTIGGSEFSETNGLNGGVFYGFGLQVVTPDAIDLAGVTANNNFLWGALLDAGGDVAILDSSFNDNSTGSPTFIDDTGLIVISDGNVVLTHVTATGNRLIGAVIDAAGTVTITSNSNGNSNFSNNQGTTTASDGTTTTHGLGLQVVSLSNIFLNGVTASGNSLFGAYLESGGEVAVNNSIFSNNGTSATPAPYGSGLEIVSAGNASIANTILENNLTFGASIQAGGPHVFLDLLTATNSGMDGVQLEAACTHLNGGTYSGNGQYGLNLVNSPLDLVSLPTFANNGAGDIFPATPAACAAIFSTANAGSVANLGSSSSISSSSLQQAVSYAPVTQQGGTATSLVGLSLNGMFGITREMTADTVVTSIFVGNYVYVYTIYNVDAEPSLDNLQIIVLSPAPLTGIARVGP